MQSVDILLSQLSKQFFKLFRRHPKISSVQVFEQQKFIDRKTGIAIHAVHLLRLKPDAAALFLSLLFRNL